MTRCAFHRDRIASGRCAECGKDICGECQEQVGGLVACIIPCLYRILVGPHVLDRLLAFDLAGVLILVALAVFAALTFVVLPLLHLAVPPESPLHVSTYVITLAGKIMCYAIVAVALDLIWGYAGILSLGHGLFFALGGYAFGMYLMRSIGRDGVYQSDLPDFMVFLDWNALPWYWQGTEHFLWALLLVLAVPALLAFVFGYFAFRSRIKGVYFSIITQALTFAAMLAFFRNDMGFGGNNGFTDFKRILGFPITAPETRTVLYALSVLYLFGALCLARWLVTGKLGRVLVAIRDQESRLLFLGYRTLHYKLFVWTLAAVMSGIAGALYVPQVGIINPSEMTPEKSLEGVVWVALGGRGTLLGPVIGAVSVNALKSWATREYPDLWLIILGLSLVVVVMFMPKGLAGLPAQLTAMVRSRWKSPEPVEEEEPDAITETAPNEP